MHYLTQQRNSETIIQQNGQYNRSTQTRQSQIEKFKLLILNRTTKNIISETKSIYVIIQIGKLNTEVDRVSELNIQLNQ
jgi:hypothetical protein